MLTAKVDTSEMRTLAVGTKRVMASGTARAVRVALKAGADHARANHQHQRRSGLLTSKAMLYGEMKRADDAEAWGYLTNVTPYVRHVEFATKPHVIRPKEGHGFVGPLKAGQSRRAKTDIGTHRIALRWLEGGRVRFARVVHHPGTRAMPFMFPAAEYAETVLLRETEAFTFVHMAALWD